MNLRRAMLVGAIFASYLALFPSARAAGRYELTKDSGTYIWNNYPKPGDEAIWAGAKDAEGFATGTGVLTWLKNGKFVSRYSGTMTRGKLHGSVTNEDASGKKFRGTFIEGIKSADWSEATAVATPPAARSRR